MTGARSILSHTIATEVDRARQLANQRAAQPICCGPCAADNHDACLAQQPCDCPGCNQGQQASAEAQALQFLPGERVKVNGFWQGWVAGPPTAS